MVPGRFFHRLMVFLAIAMVLSWGTGVSADSDRSKRPEKQPGQGLVQDGRQESGPKISRGQAANLAKQRFKSHRVMGVSKSGNGNAPMYRVKMLSPDGVVKSVFVDGRTGEVFK